MEITDIEIGNRPELNERLEKCIESWKMEYETREGDSSDFSFQKQLAELIVEGFNTDNQFRVSILRTDDNSGDLEKFENKKELSNGEFEVVVKAFEGEVTNPNKERPTILVPSQRTGLTLIDGNRNVLVLTPNELNSISTIE